MIPPPPRGPHRLGRLSPLIALIGGALVVLLVGLLPGRAVRERGVPALTIAALGATLGMTIWQWHDDKSIVAPGALRSTTSRSRSPSSSPDRCLAAVLLSLGEPPRRAGRHGEYHALLLSAVAGMFVLVAAQNLITLFLGLELLSIPLYVLCATELRRERSLESGLKYLIIGSVGSATLLYGLALIYGATGSTDFGGIAAALKEASCRTRCC